MQVTSHRSRRPLRKILFRGARQTLLTVKQRHQKGLRLFFFFFFFPPLVLETFGSLASLWDREPQKCVRTWRRSGANASLRNNQAPCEDERYAAHVRGLVELAEFQSKENKQVSWAENRILWKRTAPARLAFSAFHTAGADTKWPNDQAKGSSTWDLQGSAVCSCCLHQN